MRRLPLAVCLAATLIAAGCRQPDGPLPVETDDDPNRISDVAKDLLNAAGGFMGLQVNAYLSDRLGRRRMFRLFGAGFVVMASFYLLAPLGNSAWTLLPAGMVYGFFQFGLYGSFGPYFTELFPTEIRGSGQSFAYNLGRAMSGLAFTMPVAWMIDAKMVGISTGMLIGALSGIVLAIIATLMLPETVGRDLSEPAPTLGVK